MISIETRTKPSERTLYTLWQKANTLSAGLVTEDGRRFRVVYPGRLNTRAGPDFLDAVLTTETGERLVGDIEIHLNAPDWYAHHHDIDPNYNGVVLHVVLRPKGKMTTTQQSGIEAPIASIVALTGESTETPENRSATPSEQSHQPDVGEMLDMAGDERFLSKSKGVALELADAEPEQVLYHGVMEALGYASNRKPFRELAERLPVTLFANLRNEPQSTRILGIRAMLLGTAGLLSQLPSDESKLLKNLRKHLPKTRSMSPDSWHTFRVRPSNHPIKRIEGAALLLNGFLETGLVKGIENCLLNQDSRTLTSQLTVPPFIGKARASDVVVNVLLPFFYAYAGIARSERLRRRCLEIYRNFPKLEDNEIIREMRRLLSLDSVEVKIDTARRQQGLIQMYKSLPHRVMGRSAGGQSPEN